MGLFKGPNFDQMGSGDLVNKDVKDLPEQIEAAKKEQQKAVSRRKFLKTLGMAAAGLATGRVFQAFNDQDKRLEQEEEAEQLAAENEALRQQEEELKKAEEEPEPDVSIVNKNRKIDI